MRHVKPALSVLFALLILALLTLRMSGVNTDRDLNRLAYLFGIIVVTCSVLLLLAYVVLGSQKNRFRALPNIVLVATLGLTTLLPLIGLFANTEARLAVAQGRYLADMTQTTATKYLDTHFGFHNWLLRRNSIIKVRYFHASSVANVILGKNRWLFYRPGVDDYRELTSLTDTQLQFLKQTIEEERDSLAQMGICYLIVIAPNKETIYPEYLPTTATRVQQKTELDQFLEYLKVNSDIDILDLRASLLEAKTRYPVYYRSDTHWNHYGAFVADCEIIKQLSARFPNLQPPSSSDYDVVPEDASLSCDLANLLALPDMFRESEAPSVVLKADWTSSQAKLKKAVVFSDSFYTALGPYLSTHFQDVITAPMGARFDRALVEREQPDVVISVYVERNFGAELGLDRPLT
jgi:alginate O-acetyltransferase complex protein AlgJ